MADFLQVLEMSVNVTSNILSYLSPLNFISDSTAQSVLCQPIVQSNGELIGKCSYSQFCGLFYYILN